MKQKQYKTRLELEKQRILDDYERPYRENAERAALDEIAIKNVIKSTDKKHLLCKYRLHRMKFIGRFGEFDTFICLRWGCNCWYYKYHNYYKDAYVF